MERSKTRRVRAVSDARKSERARRATFTSRFAKRSPIISRSAATRAHVVSPGLSYHPPVCIGVESIRWNNSRRRENRCSLLPLDGATPSVLFFLLPFSPSFFPSFFSFPFFLAFFPPPPIHPAGAVFLRHLFYRCPVCLSFSTDVYPSIIHWPSMLQQVPRSGRDRSIRFYNRCMER